MDSVYDRALGEIGTGRFHRSFDLIYIVVFSGFWCIAYMQMILSLTVIPHTCKLPENTGNMTDYEWKMKYIPYETIRDEIKFDGCHIFSNPDENNVTHSCEEYEYDKTWYESTVPSDKGWVCDQQMHIPNILAYSKITELIGTMFFGWLGDAYGRRPTYITTLVLIVLGRAISILAGRSYAAFLSGCLVSSFGVWTTMQSATLVSVEIASPKRRSMITSMRFTSGCIGGIVAALMFWWLRDWKTFVIVTTAPLVIFILFSWHMIESPRWQFSNGKAKQCLKQLKRIARANRRSLTAETEQELLSHVPEEKTKALGPIAFFSSRRLAINTLLQLSLWTVGNICFTTQLLTIGQSQGNPFLEFCWQTLGEVPANFLSAWLADRMGRRRSGAMAFSVMAAAWSLLALREASPYPWTRAWWIGTILNVIIRLFNAVSYYAANLFAMELYPTCLRQSGLSMGNVFASMGSIVAPYILFLGRPIDERLPSFIISALCIGSVFCNLSLPETLNRKLPETIEEAQSFGRKSQKYSSVRVKRMSVPQEKCTEQINETIA